MNRIFYKIPVHVTNMDHVETEFAHLLQFSVLSGNPGRLHHSVQEVIVKEASTETPALVNPTVASVELANNLTKENAIVAGNAAVYKVLVSVPAGFCNLSLELTGESAQSIV